MKSLSCYKIYILLSMNIFTIPHDCCYVCIIALISLSSKLILVDHQVMYIYGMIYCTCWQYFHSPVPLAHENILPTLAIYISRHIPFSIMECAYSIPGSCIKL